MMWPIVACFLSAALACWAFVALDLGRRAIEHAKASEERRRADEGLSLARELAKRVERLETAERQTVAVLGRRG